MEGDPRHLDALFSRREHLHLGGWRTHQRRSYFALQLTNAWWIWGMDSQLDDDVDQPQKDYFTAIAKKMDRHSKIILCGPEPGWLYTMKKGSNSFAAMDYIALIATDQNRDLTFPLVLSGDTHHYSRYVGNEGTQFITSGGGGAFLHPTHQVEQTVNLDRPTDNIQWIRGRVTTLALGKSMAGNNEEREAVYPSRADSLRMLAGNFKFVAYNPGFALVLGVLYWLLGLLVALDPTDGRLLAPALLFAGFWGYTKNQEGGGWKIFLVSGVNALFHSFALFLLVDILASLNLHWFGTTIWPRPVFLTFAVEMILIGGLAAGFLFGAYLYVTSRWLKMNHNDAFSSMRLNSHRHFLRIRIKDDEVTIYPIALDQVPLRSQWRFNTGNVGTPPPVYVPSEPLKPHLIEHPITIRATVSALRSTP